MISRTTVVKPHATFQRSVPDDIRALDTFTDPDYADLFSVPAATEHARQAPKQWARSLSDNLPLSLRAVMGTALLLQRALLGLRPHRGAPADALPGWHIAAHGDRWLRLEADGWLMGGHIVVRLDDDRIDGATFVRYHHPLARVVWPTVSLIHRQVGLALMRHMASR